MFNANDIKTVFAYNVNANIFRVTPAKRVSWRLLNIDVATLNKQLSKPLVYAEDFAALKKQVRAQLKLEGAV